MKKTINFKLSLLKQESRVFLQKLKAELQH